MSACKLSARRSPRRRTNRRALPDERRPLRFGFPGSGRARDADARPPTGVVLDLDLPGGEGATALRELRQTRAQVRVLVLTVHAEQERLLRRLAAGAGGGLTTEAASRGLTRGA